MIWIFEKGRIYSVENNELMAEATFIESGVGEVIIDHTYVNPVLRGQGVAGKMMEEAASFFRKEKLKVSATCSFAKGWLLKNREAYADIISADFDNIDAACKIDGKR